MIFLNDTVGVLRAELTEVKSSDTVPLKGLRGSAAMLPEGLVYVGTLLDYGVHAAIPHIKM